VTRSPAGCPPDQGFPRGASPDDRPGRSQPLRGSGSYGVAARGRGKPFHPDEGHRPSRLARFVETYGWRAYAIPILVVATFLCGVDLVHAPPPGAGTVPTLAEPRDTEIYVDLPEGGPASQTGNPADPNALPPGTAAYVTTGKGTFHPVPGGSPVSGQGPLQQYTVEVENGITLNEQAFAAEVQKILGDRRGWGAGGRMSFQRVDNPARAAFRVTLTSMMTVRDLCGYTVRAETSCFNGPSRRAVINEARWVRGAVSFVGDLEMYHQYVISHEVGHAFGHRHELCATAGGPAPVMMQQTLTTGRCRPNPWPFPDGVHEVRGPPAPDNLPVRN
jgi:hypothetical protein